MPKINKYVIIYKEDKKFTNGRGDHVEFNNAATFSKDQFDYYCPKLENHLQFLKILESGKLEIQ